MAKLINFIEFICVFALGCIITYLYCSNTLSKTSSLIDEEQVPIESEVTEEVFTETVHEVVSDIDFEIPEIPEDCIAYLYIPSCSISAFIRYGSTMEAISNGHVGEFENTGEIGVDNYCILGHARDGKDNLVFTGMEKQISFGDDIYVVKDNILYTFKVGHYRVVNPDGVWILSKTGYPCITIMCCTNKGAQRFVVFGNLVESRILSDDMDEILKDLSISIESIDSTDDRLLKADKIFQQCMSQGLIIAYEYDSGSYTFTYDDGTLGEFKVLDF